ncbi:hypothetical protein [Flavobacterium sp. ABG]|uniref:hypothetical protein n=1 Tax=Flavobacterium sp. ABG TaxID=1423322 RepID=UPI00064AA3A6|nr:hypothetical protein [Flavobacterium sp. ABG]KLT69932.1 hypothetical protein AB674_09520 [Flavobacterium sp. ABG]
MALTIAQLKDLVNINLADNSNIIPAEHRAVELALIDYIETLQPISNSNLPLNKGYITANDADTGGFEVGIEIGIQLSNRLRKSGNVNTVTCVSSPNNTILTVNLQNPHPNNNYIVKSWFELVPTSPVLLQNTAAVGQPVFNIISGAQFQIVLKEWTGGIQALRLHFETVGY